MLDSERDTMGAALKLLGYSLNTTDETEIDAAVDKLIEQKPLVSAYDSVNIKRAMVQGVGFVMTYSGYYMIGVMAMGGDQKALDLAPYVLPKEGYPLWADNLVIPAASDQGVRRTSLHGLHAATGEPGRARHVRLHVSGDERGRALHRMSWSTPRCLSEADLERAERIADVGEVQRVVQRRLETPEVGLTS